MVMKRDYTAEAVEAAKSVMLELVRLLGEYRDDIVLIGGWVPDLLIPHGAPPHVGSTDIDLALNHLTLQDAGYRSIHELLESRGYRQGKQPFIYLRDVPTKRGSLTVQVDLLAGQYEGTGKARRHQQVQDVHARKVRGCDLAFQLYREVAIEGALPGGGLDRATIRVASIVPFFVMKAAALAERLKEKDAWDIYYCLQCYPGGLEAIVGEFSPHLTHGLVKEGLATIAEKFASVDHVGPKYVADFEELEDPEDRALKQQDAYQRVRALLERLNHFS